MTPSKHAVQVSLATALPAYRPGDTITALLHASTFAPAAVDLQEMQVNFAGIERVDTSWVSPNYRRDVPAINSDKRRLQRHLVTAGLHATTQGSFADGNVRRFLIRFTLPTWLPPTFRGTAVRYSYYLEAKISYALYDAGPAGPPSNTPNTAAHEDDINNGHSAARVPSEERTATARLLLHIWPSEAAVQADASQTAPPGHSFPGTTSSEEVSIKCWEVGPGTAVEDAVNHISTLARTSSGPGPLFPYRANSFGVGLEGSVPGHPQPAGPSLSRRPSSSSGRSAHGPSSEISSHEDHRDAAQDRASAVAASRAASASAALSRRSTEGIAEASAAAAAGTAVEGSGGGTGAVGAGGLRTFALRIGEQALAKLSVHPPLSGQLQPGATVAVSVEFPSPMNDQAGKPPLQCTQMTALLETEEIVDGAWRPRSQTGGNPQVLRNVVEEQIETTVNTACTHFLFTVPRDATPGFQTSLVMLRWMLRFHFLAVPLGGGEGSGRAIAYGGPSEHVMWSLPLTVVSPLQTLF